jgi:hypothetical protein
MRWITAGTETAYRVHADHGSGTDGASVFFDGSANSNQDRSFAAHQLPDLRPARGAGQGICRLSAAAVVESNLGERAWLGYQVRRPSIPRSWPRTGMRSCPHSAGLRRSAERQLSGSAGRITRAWGSAGFHMSAQTHRRKINVSTCWRSSVGLWQIDGRKIACRPGTHVAHGMAWHGMARHGMALHRWRFWGLSALPGSAFGHRNVTSPGNPPPSSLAHLLGLASRM